MASPRQEPTYNDYHCRRLAGRTELLLIGGGVAYTLFLLAGGGFSWGWWAHVLLVGIFVGCVRAIREPSWAIPAVLVLNAVPPAALLTFDPKFSATHPEWMVYGILGFAALTPLPSPGREIQTLMWATTLSISLLIFGQTPDPQGAASMLAAIALGWVASWATVESWRKTFEDGEMQRQLTDRLAGARDALQHAVQQTRDELASQQDRLVQQERLATLGRLAAGIAHEINNPLAVALTNLELASSERDPDPLLLEDAKASLRRIRNIVADLTRVARPGDVEQVEAIPLEPILSYAADVVRVIVKGQMRIRMNATPGTRVRANRGRLEQVMVNLLVNAWQAVATRGRGSVSITTAIDAGFLVMHVDDDGPGIPDDMIDEIFEPFFTTKPAGEGSGLGLAISRSYMRAMGGELTAERSPMGGARFTVQIPAVPDTELRIEPREEEPEVDPPSLPSPEPITDPGALPTLLIVDDEPGLRRSLARGLRRQWRVLTAANRGEALAIAEKDSIDVVLCDMVLADEAGIDVVRALAGAVPGVLNHTLFMSGEPAGTNLLAVARLNAQHMVRKPFELDDLAKRLQEAKKGHRHPLILDATPEPAEPRRYNP